VHPPGPTPDPTPPPGAPPAQILAAKLKPNLGRFESPPDWEEILAYFRGSELQNYFTKVLEDDLKVGPF
jgi:translation initiation factor RLI1